MYWIIYSIFNLILSWMLSGFFKKNRYYIFIFLVIFFTTPAQISTQESNLAPSLFTFIFNSLFEKDFSFITLRPLMLSMPSSLFLLFLFSRFRRRFF